MYNIWLYILQAVVYASQAHFSWYLRYHIMYTPCICNIRICSPGMGGISLNYSRNVYDRGQIRYIQRNTENTKVLLNLKSMFCNRSDIVLKPIKRIKIKNLIIFFLQNRQLSRKLCQTLDYDVGRFYGSYSSLFVI